MLMKEDVTNLHLLAVAIVIFLREILDLDDQRILISNSLRKYDSAPNLIAITLIILHNMENLTDDGLGRIAQCARSATTPHPQWTQKCQSR